MPELRSLLPLFASLFFVGCDTTDPFTSGPARASVAGIVADNGGTPRADVSIRIACAGGGSPITVLTDSVGHYLVNLSTDSDPFEGGGGRLRCVFREPATGAARAQVDTSLGFARGPVLVALQNIDLRER